ncbi:response regulator [Paenibacillus sp. MBLB4367]|uniref:response regulator n=1 Tax=Paenibacillus sp. MBLB4367 TaxID=3384767 RepID=UPI003907FEDE
MKVLIVDDEKHVRDAIRLLLDWQSYGIETILEAGDGESAVRIVEEEQPEFVFTDMMMPGKNGVQLLEWLQANAPRTKSIVISGHDDFEFVRNTVKYGGMDYILKPIDPAELEEAMRKASEARCEEDRALLHSNQRNIEMNQIKPVYWDKMFSNLIAEPSYLESIYGSLQQEFGLTREHTDCRIAILNIDTMDKGIRDKFAASADLLFFSLVNICNEYLRKRNAGYAFRYWNSSSDIMLLFWRETDAAQKLLHSINEGIAGALKAKFDIGLGTVKPFPGGLTQSLHEAGAALLQRNLLRRQAWIHEFSTKHSAKPPALHFSDFEEAIRLALRSGIEERIRSATEAWFDAVRRLTSISLENLELWRHEYSVLRARYLKEFPEETANEWQESLETAVRLIPLDDEGNLSVELWQQEWTQGMLDLSRHTLRQRKDDHAIYEVAKYIQNHYQNELALQDIANRFYLSREHISRKFKQAFGENLSDYIERIRLQKAKLLLQSPHLRVAQVAEMVGYRDEKYFSKVFKKAEGLSPGEYRKQQL